MNVHVEELPALLATDVDGYFEQLMLAYQQRLYGFALRLVGNEPEAEDIVQEAFVRAYHALKSYPAWRISSLHLRQWLYKITLNVFRNSLRKAEVQTVVLELEEDSPVLEIEDAMTGPAEEVHRREWRDELEKQVAQLPSHYRVAVNLHYFEELSLREIAELLNQPVGTVKANVHRGLRLLRKALEAEMNEAR